VLEEERLQEGRRAYCTCKWSLYSPCVSLWGGLDTSDVEKARDRNLRWMEALWEVTSTSAKEEDHKEDVLAVFRALVRESRNERELREYVPWQPLW
jgi:hypothetical protein